MPETRAYTPDECRAMFLDHVRGLVSYWDQIESEGQRRRLEGLAFSILAALDGVAGGLPAFVVAPSPHPDDQADCVEMGDNWWPTDHPDIAGSLHELFYPEACRG